MQEIEDLFVPYEQSLDLKELDFDEPCFAYFDIQYNPILKEKYKGILKFPSKVEYLESTKKMLYILGQQKVLAPTYSQAFRWFRKKYNISSYVDYYENGDCEKIWYFIVKTKNNEKQFDGSDKTKYCNEPYFKTYEEAELECLKKLIEIVKLKK
jgi:hypothetical protein